MGMMMCVHRGLMMIHAARHATNIHNACTYNLQQEGECHALQKVVEGLSLRTTAVPLYSATTLMGADINTGTPFRQQSTSSSAVGGIGLGWGSSVTQAGASMAISPTPSTSGPILSGGPSTQQQQGVKAEGESLTGWISSTLGIDEATVTSYLPKLW